MEFVSELIKFLSCMINVIIIKTAFSESVDDNRQFLEEKFLWKMTVAGFGATMMRPMPFSGYPFQGKLWKDK